MQNKIPQYIVPISLDSIGERTKSRWSGTFYVKCILTHMDEFNIERVYSDLIPKNPSRDLGDELIMRAETIAQLSSRIVQGPAWWDTSRGGKDLIDSNPLYDLLGECYKATKKWDEDLEKQATSGDTDASIPT
jgi:hypothetical protein